jgi:hypothetical protein
VDLHHQLFAGFTGAPEYKMSGIPAPETRTFTGHALEQGEPIGENQGPV